MKSSHLWVLLVCVTSVARAEILIDFEAAEVAKPIPTWTEHGVVFAPARPLEKSEALPRIMFFPHVTTGKKGILNAMAAEAIPVRATFPTPASAVTLLLWGSTGSAALVEAFDRDGRLVDHASLEVIPRRAAPADPVPTFRLTVRAEAIAYIHFSGPKPGGFLVADELRYTPTAQ